LQIEINGGKAIIVYCDHSDAKQTHALFEQIEREQNGQLDVLVNNAFAAVQFILGLFFVIFIRKIWL
jgi:NAD(P)-dependent dehydrogenase (short-subunit alcohol dehydrogenase family)